MSPNHGPVPNKMRLLNGASVARLRDARGRGVVVSILRGAAALSVMAWVLAACTEALPPPPQRADLTVTVSANGAASGFVLSEPGGIDLRAAGSQTATFPVGAVVTLVATAADGSVVVGFTPATACLATSATAGAPLLFGGPEASGDRSATCVVALEASRSVAVTFAVDAVTPPPAPPTERTMIVTLGGDGSGVVRSTPAGIDLASGSQSAVFAEGAVVTLSAHATAGSVLEGFAPAGMCEPGRGDDVCVVTMDGDRSVTVSFVVEASPPPPPAVDRVDLLVDNAVQAGFVELSRPQGAVLQSVVALRPGMLVRAKSASDGIRVAWIAAEAAAGPQVRLLFAADSNTGGLPEVLAAELPTGPTGTDLGLGSLAVVPETQAVPSTVPLTLSPFDHAKAGPVLLAAAFADHPLGDVDGNGRLEVRDALWLLARTRDQAWTAYQQYHADLDADDVSDLADVLRLLDKLVDPSLSAELHVKPRALAFGQLDPATDREAIVLVANQGRLPLNTVTWEQVHPARATGVTRTLLGGIDGQSQAWSLALPPAARRGWLPGDLRVRHSTDAATLRLGQLVVLIAGQSNAVGVGSPLAGWPEAPTPGVRLLGNDYLWKNAYEPLDDPAGQLDLVSRDLNARYSFGTRLGNLLEAGTGFPTVLIPTAKAASQVSAWLPAADRRDRGTLFGSANFRAQVSAGLASNPVLGQPLGAEGGPVSVLVWYQGESDNFFPADRDQFRARTDQVMDAFVAELGVPVVYVQLASQHSAQLNLLSHAIAEHQRRMETTHGAAGERRDRFHMVVAFDLPRSDSVHPSAFGMRVLAERIDLAIRQHVLGEAVDGTGPRLARVAWSGTQVFVETTHLLAAVALDPRHFAVFDGPPTGSLDDVATYGANSIEIVTAERDPADGRRVLLTLAQAPGQTPHVRYMALPNVGPSTSEPSMPEAWEVMPEGIVVAAQGGLPLPVFGPLAAVAQP